MAASSTRRRLRPWLARFLLLGVTLFICVGLLEILVRVFMPYYNPRNQIPIKRNAEGVALGIPNLATRQGTPQGDFMTEVRFNRHGFRDVKDFMQATTNDFFVAGDSFSIGWGVEEDERYANLLEKQFGVRFYNFAIPEDIRGYARTLQFVNDRHPCVRRLVVGLCMENDLWDYPTITDTHLVYQKQMIATTPHKVAAWFRNHSALWLCASYTLQKSPAIRGVLVKIGIARDVDELSHKNVGNREVLESSRDELLKFATHYESVVLIIPSRALWAGKNIEVEKKVHDEFVRLLREAGLKLVDMRPIFEQAGDPLSFYFRNNPHWNVKGHALAAQALADFFQKTEPWNQLLSTPRVPPP